MICLHVWVWTGTLSVFWMKACSVWEREAALYNHLKTAGGVCAAANKAMLLHCTLTTECDVNLVFYNQNKFVHWVHPYRAFFVSQCCTVTSRGSRFMKHWCGWSDNTFLFVVAPQSFSDVWSVSRNCHLLSNCWLYGQKPGFLNVSVNRWSCQQPQDQYRHQ